MPSFPQKMPLNLDSKISNEQNCFVNCDNCLFLYETNQT